MKDYALKSATKTLPAMSVRMVTTHSATDHSRLVASLIASSGVLISMPRIIPHGGA